MKLDFRINKFRIKRVYIYKEANIIYIVKSSTSVHSFEDIYGVMTEVIKNTIDFINFEELFVIINKNMVLSIDDLDIIIKTFFNEYDLLEFERFENLYDIKYDRMIRYFERTYNLDVCEAIRCLKKIQNTNVCIIGIGGLGSHILLSLAMMGVEKLTIIDFDKVEISNLTRQIIFKSCDIGESKVIAAKREILSRNSHIAVNCIETRISHKDDLKVLDSEKIDVVFCCADTPRGRIKNIVDSYFYDRNVCVVYGGSINDKIIVGPIIDKHTTKSYNCLFKNQVFGVELGEYIADIIEPISGICSNLMTVEFLNYLFCLDKCNTIGKVKTYCGIVDLFE